MRTVTTTLFIAGLACVVYGCALIYRPLGWLVGGALLFGLALLMDRETKSE